MRLYADSSALAKLIKREAESDRLLQYLDSTSPSLLTSALAYTELHRTATAAGIAATAVDLLLRELVDTHSVTDELLQAAGRLPAPPTGLLRSLDAIHLATALQVGCSTFLTYDFHQAEAARFHGLTVVRPE